MGLFFKKKKIKKETHVDDARVYLSETKNQEQDMVSLIKNEQQNQDMENPFVETAPTVAQKSVAKRYGTKYIGAPGKQIASSIVVDVRSYKKPEPIKNVSKLFEDEEPEEKVEKKTSFFDEIMKSLDEEDDFDFGENSKDEEVVENPQPKPKKDKKSSTSGKRKIDIDIISGDFGGADVI